MLEIKETKWVIMDKERTVIAKGSPRNRHLVPVNKTKDKKRILYYSSEGMARAGFTTSGFYTWEINGVFGSKRWDEYELEPVEVEFIIREKHHE